MTLRRRGGSGRAQATVLNLPLHMLAPRLLPDQAKTSAALDHLERGEIIGMIVDRDEGSRM